MADQEPGSGLRGDRRGPAVAAAGHRALPVLPAVSVRLLVGAVIVAADGDPMATGFSRQRDPHDHAEEGALATAALPAIRGWPGRPCTARWNPAGSARPGPGPVPS